ncbi:MAG: response regulator [Mariprofundaceae bacterium]|nr:response regulator [Mariprofundaceae bacterium]
MRILSGIIGSIYLYLHGPFMEPYKGIFVASACLYFTYNILTLITARHKPASIFRMLSAPLMDVYAVSLGMVIDGGQSSGLYLLFFIIIFSNAARFGNSMMLYSQALSVAGMLLVSISTLYGMQLSLDGMLLLMQTIAILLIPACTLIITPRPGQAITDNTAAQDATFGLLDRGPLPVFSYQVGEDGMPRILHANTGMQHVCRNAVTGLAGEQVDTLALEEDGDVIINACRRPFQDNGSSEESYRFYMRGRNARNHLIRLMGQSMRTHRHGRQVGVCFLLDITRTEAARNRLEQTMHNNYIGAALAGIIHDFRNLLASIIGTAEVMQFSAGNAEVKHQLGLIMDAGERGSGMLSRLQELSKNGQQQADPPPDPYLLHESLATTVGLLRIGLPPHIQLHLDADSPLPAVSATVADIEQTVIHLINNAAEAIPRSGHIRVALSSYHGDKLSPEEDMALCITVSDDGNGIPQEHIDDLTRPFRTSRKDEGKRGLGLTVVQRMVQKSGGRMEISSVVGEGTRVSVCLPAANHQFCEPAGGHGSAMEKMADEMLPARAWNLLLVDDSPDVLAVHQAQLESMGHHVITANDGASALQLFRQQQDRIDLVVTDFKMPQMDGVGLSLAIHEMRPETRILIITAHADIKKLRQINAPGICFLSKPATRKKLNNTIAVIQNGV